MSVLGNMYRCNIRNSMTWLGERPEVIFMGQGLINAGRIYNTLNNVPLDKCLEMPIAEDLIMGMAIGMSLEGYRPIVVFQRHDFMLIAADQIINHLCLIPQMSGGQVKLPVIIRAIVGQREGTFDVGPQHKHDFTHIFSPYIDTIVIDRYTDILRVYEEAYRSTKPILIVERRDLYEAD
jgi:pyruvate/2-oxoglutarate/acetoin dehydrogenase E1 component